MKWKDETIFSFSREEESDMSIIQCPQCGKEISNRATQCIHCGYNLQEPQECLKYCQECGSPIKNTENTCPYCGCPVEDFVQPARNKKNHMLHFVVTIVVIACVAIVGYGIYQYNNRITYYKVVDEINTARNESVDEVNECSALLMDVWNNAIWEVSDPKTDPFTCPNGVFVEDFNDALQSLYSDAAFCEKLDVIEEQQLALRKLEKQLPTAPKGLEGHSELTHDMVENHVDLSMLVLQPSGNYYTVLDQFNELFDQANEILMELESYNE